MGRKPRKGTAQETPILSDHAVLLYHDETSVATAPPPIARKLSGSWGVSMNLTNSIVGAGVIAIPHAMADGGFLPVLVLLFLGALMTMYSMNVIVRLGDMHSVATYEDLAAAAFGRRGFFTVCFFQFTFSFGANCSYLTVVADTLPPLLGHVLHMPFQNGQPVVATDASVWVTIAANRDLCIVFLAAVVLFPICLQRNFAALERSSGLSILGMVVCALCLVYKCATEAAAFPHTDTAGAVYDYVAVHRKIFPAIGTIAFAYVCQHQTYLVYNSMLDKSPERFAVLSRGAVLASFVLVVLFGVPGYMLFLKDTRSDIFLNFVDTSDHIVQLCRCITVCSVVLTFPQEFMVARYTLQILLDPKTEPLFVEQAKGLALDEDLFLEAPPRRRCFRPRGSAFATSSHVALTAALMGATVSIALVDPHLGDITSLTGSFSAVALAFVLPAACHLKLGVPPAVYSRWHDHHVPWLALVFGGVAFVVATTTSIVDIVQHTSESNP
ncbi:amino acid transporter [Achlya hypogyna]|uniref:Amino acid transporter n=1 Tax=Achlya hypogyna TaxID=1202772 RepID=A0A1V9ZR56_ACHHY|nr:amino acid transporter [Achlya hypogyna]